MKKKNTRDYAKGGAVKRQNFAGGGPIYDSFGDVTEAHVNRAGGLTEGPSPEERAKHYPGKVSGIYCWSEDSTFNPPTEGYVPGRLLSGGLAPSSGGGGGDGGAGREAVKQAFALARERDKSGGGG